MSITYGSFGLSSWVLLFFFAVSYDTLLFSVAKPDTRLFPILSTFGQRTRNVELFQLRRVEFCIVRLLADR